MQTSSPAGTFKDIPLMTESYKEITADFLSELSEAFPLNNNFKMAMNAISANDMTKVLINRNLPLETYHVFSDIVEPEVRVTDQKKRFNMLDILIDEFIKNRLNEKL